MEDHPQRDTSWSSFRTRNVEAILRAAGMKKINGKSSKVVPCKGKNVVSSPELEDKNQAFEDKEI